MAKAANTRQKKALWLKVGEILGRLVRQTTAELVSRMSGLEGRLAALEDPPDLGQIEKDLTEGFSRGLRRVK